MKHYLRRTTPNFKEVAVAYLVFSHTFHSNCRIIKQWSAKYDTSYNLQLENTKLRVFV
jgi:hypothetical protein